MGDRRWVALVSARLAYRMGGTAAPEALDGALEIWSGADPGFRPAREARALQVALGEGG